MRINYAKAQRITQLLIIYIIVFTITGLASAITHVALLLNGLYIPETFIGIASGFLLAPYLLQRAKSTFLVSSND